MSATLDTVLVVFTVVLAIGYLAWRKLRSARRANRDWSSGHAEVCDSCPVLEIRKARLRAGHR
ncbi:MAG: hypothetical protein IPG71_03740 [bacterium]|nr:hypothetical protein [bacterium]